MLDLYLGRTQSGQVIRWSRAANPHIAIYGQSGQGKSYLIKQLALQAVQQGALCVVFDFSADFRRYDPADSVPFQRISVTSSEFSVNPLVAETKTKPEVLSQQLISLLHAVFRMGPRATLQLQRVVQQYLKAATELPTLQGLIDFSTRSEKQTDSLAAAMEPVELLASLLHCGTKPISIDLTTPGLMVLDFEEVIDRNVRSFLIELIMQAIWIQRTCASEESCPIILVLDEAQSLSWGKNGMPIRILREGRKFNLAGWFSTQWLDNREANAALAQAALQAHFRPDDINLVRIAKTLSSNSATDAGYYRTMLENLHVGQFFWWKPGGQSVIICVDQ